MYKQVGKLLFFEIPDGVLLAVVLPEDETREHPLLRELDEHGGECRALVEVRKIFFQIVGWELSAQTLHLVLIDGQPFACTSEKTCIGEQCASLTPALDPVLRNRARQNVEGVQGNAWMRCVQRAQICGKRVDVIRRDVRLACRE